MNQHTHKYILVKIGAKKRPELKCAIEGCAHHIAPELGIGRKSICNYCGKEFFLVKADIKKNKPHCGCRSKSASTIKTIEEILAAKLGE